MFNVEIEKKIKKWQIKRFKSIWVNMTNTQI
jgi:hypothetical protein